MAFKNVVAARDGVTVFVRSKKKPHFNTYVIVPIDIKNEKIHYDRVWSEEWQVENAIVGQLYARAFSDEFKKLDKFLEEFSNDFPVLTKRPEVIQKVKGNGYSTPYYFVTFFDPLFDDLFNYYIDNPELDEAEVKEYFARHSFESDGVSFGLNFFMENPEDSPDPEILETLSVQLKELERIPRGEYYLFLNNHFIDKKRGMGKKDNSLEEYLVIN